MGFEEVEALFVEINLSKRKWLLGCTQYENMKTQGMKIFF